MVEFTYGGKRYSLGFNRKSAAAIERAGFVRSEIGDKPNLMIPLLVYGAFQMNHRKVNEKEVNKIYESISDKDGFVNALLESYQKTFDTLLEKSDDTEEGGENLTEWTVT